MQSSYSELAKVPTTSPQQSRTTMRSGLLLIACIGSAVAQTSEPRTPLLYLHSHASLALTNHPYHTVLTHSISSVSVEKLHVEPYTPCCCDHLEYIPCIHPRAPERAWVDHQTHVNECVVHPFFAHGVWPLPRPCVLVATTRQTLGCVVTCCDMVVSVCRDISDCAHTHPWFPCRFLRGNACDGNHERL